MYALEMKNVMFIAIMTPTGMAKKTSSALRLPNQQLLTPNL
jgi:hypothetical protein